MHTVQIQYVVQFSPKLKERCNSWLLDAALLQVSQVSKLEAPDKYDIKRLREWLEDKDKGAEFLSAPEEGTWSEENDSDQVTLMSRENGFSRWTATLFIHIYDVIWGRHRKVRSSHTMVCDDHR
jgi:hypothetical protein